MRACVRARIHVSVFVSVPLTEATSLSLILASCNGDIVPVDNSADRSKNGKIKRGRNPFSVKSNKLQQHNGSTIISPSSSAFSSVQERERETRREKENEKNN